MVLKVQPLGGVRAALRVAEACGLPVVVSSAVDTSVGLAAGVALAAALPELPYACGLATMSLLDGDVTADPLVPERGELPVRRPAVDVAQLARFEADPAPWRDRAAAAARFLPDLMSAGTPSSRAQPCRQIAPEHLLQLAYVLFVYFEHLSALQTRDLRRAPMSHNAQPFND